MRNTCAWLLFCCTLVCKCKERMRWQKFKFRKEKQNFQHSYLICRYIHSVCHKQDFHQITEKGIAMLVMTAKKIPSPIIFPVSFGDLCKISMPKSNKITPNHERIPK